MDDGSEGSRRAPENEYKLLDSLFTSFGLIGFACVCCVFCRDEWEKDGGEGGECSRVWDFGPEVSSSLAFPHLTCPTLGKVLLSRKLLPFGKVASRGGLCGFRIGLRV